MKPITGTWICESMNNTDHFSRQSAEYARYRPHYPEYLFEFLAGCCRERELAWDCATGNGQAASGLAGWFKQVIATDISSAQLALAIPAENISYHVSPAEQTGIRNDSFDLVMVAQALHWFDTEAFYNEARRVLKRDGVLAVVTYRLPRISREIDGMVFDYYSNVLGDFWPDERRHIDNAYAEIPFPLQPITCPPMHMEHNWTLEQFAGFLSSWSAAVYYREKRGSDPLERVLPGLAAHWSSSGETKTICWPLTVLAGKFMENY